MAGALQETTARSPQEARKRPAAGPERQSREWPMNALGYHLRFRLTEPRVIVSSPLERRLVANIVLAQGRAVCLVACDLPDDHHHMVALCGRAQAGLFTRSLESSLKQRLVLPLGFQQYEPKPILEGRHLYNAVRYVLRQPERHGVQVDPFRESSNLPDLLGMRMLGAYAAPALRAVLPRLRRAELLEWLGVPDLRPTDSPPEGVLEATLRATGLTALQGGGPRKCAARRAAARVLAAQRSARETSDLLGLPLRTVTRLRMTPAEPLLVHAIQLQLGLAAQLGTRASLEGTF